MAMLISNILSNQGRGNAGAGQWVTLNGHVTTILENYKMLDQLVGMAMLSVATVVFVYYTVWVFVVPFVDDSLAVTKLFPPREWAVRIPGLLLAAGSGVIGTFISVVLIRSERKRKAKLAAKKDQ